MNKIRSLNWKFYLHGSLMGVLSAFFGSIVFTVIDHIIRRFSIYGFSVSNLFYAYDLEFFALIVGVGFFLTFIPALLGGFILARLQQHDARRGKLSTKRGMIEGGILGIIAALGVSNFVIDFLALSAGRFMAYRAILIHVSCAVVSATLAGIWTGKKVSLRFQKITKCENREE